jgi:hypothetical protein
MLSEKKSFKDFLGKIKSKIQFIPGIRIGTIYGTNKKEKYEHTEE